MSIDTLPTVTPKAPGRRRLTVLQLTLIGAAVFVVVCVVRVLSGAGDLNSSGTLGAAIGLSVPIVMAGLGGLWSERSGVVNIGLEGMMILGTWGAGWAGSLYGPWHGLLIGTLMGAMGAVIHALATVTFGVDHIVSGVAINLLGLGVTQYLSAVAFEGQPTQSPSIQELPSLTIPGLSTVSESIESQGWFLISDLAGVVHALSFQLSWTTIISGLLLVLSWWLLWRTPFGLRIRSCGESPSAAESLGVNVYRYKYVAVIVSGALAGFAGASLATFAGLYREGQTQGLGFIGLAAMIFGNWRIGGLVMGALLFGYLQAMQLRSGDAVHALLLVIAILLVGLLVVSVMRQAVAAAVASGVFAALFAIWYFSTESLPDQIPYVTPYVVTLLVLSLASQRLRMPAADGLRYRRGEVR